MKTKLLLSLLLSFYFYLLSSQAPLGFTYQAIARDGSGNPLLNQALPVRITIQSDSLGGTTFWIEEHPSVTTNGFGLFTLILGKGIKQIGSTASTFNDIDWRVTPKFIRTEINYGGWKNMGSSRLWSVPYSMVAGDLSGAVKKLAVTGETSDMEEALFEVKNKNGQTVFAVYNEGVRVYIDDGLAKGTTKGGFAIGGFGTVKSPGQEYFRVTPDSTRVYVDNGINKGATKGGFAIGGFSTVKAPIQEYLRVTNDSTRVYVNDGVSKGATKGGFAIGGFNTFKGQGQEYLRVTQDSTRIYVNNNIAKGATKGGFAIGGFDQVKGGQDEYLRVTSDSVKVSKSLLIPRLDTYERDHLSFVPGEALIIFNTTEGCMQIFKNNVWSNIWCFNCAPSFIIQPVDNTICSGNRVTFFVSATGTSLSYQWQQSSDNGNTWTNISNGGSNPAVSGSQSYSLTLSNVPVGLHNYKYRCVVTGSCLPNVTSNSVTLNVGSTPPLIYSQPTDQQLSAGCTANFNIVSPGYGITYKWQQSTDGGNNWSDISNGGSSPVYSGCTASTLSLSNVPLSCNNYKYRCTLSNLCGTDITSTSAILTISPVSIVTQPTNQQLTTDCNVSFSISTPPGYVILYQWQTSSNNGSTWGNISDGGTSPAYSGTTSSILNLSNVPIAYNNYQYRCVVSSLCGPNETSSAAILSLNSSPVITVQPVNKLVYSGQNINFNIITAGINYNYQWQESNDDGVTWTNLLNGGTSPAYIGVLTTNLYLNNVPISYNNYKYRCVVKHYCRNDVVSDAARLSVPASDPVTDIDGNSYNTVGIGSQLWMGSNLKTTKYTNGDLIGTTSPISLDISGETTPKYQWAAGGSETNVATFGRLYTWYALIDNRNICPTGWHIPSDEEWITLAAYLKDENVGGKLKETGTSHFASPNMGATNETGFTALPAGARNDNGAFFYFGNIAGYLWSSTIDQEVTTPPYAWYRSFGYGNGDLAKTAGSMHYGLSVRCIKDN